MKLYLSLLFIFPIFNCGEIATIKNVTISNKSFDVKNQSIETNNNNITVDMQRITQPSAQSKQIQRTLTSSTANTTAKETKFDFRPSPQLETYYEFNRFPVPPALPEAKHFSVFNNLGDSPIQWPQNQESSLTTEQSWTTRIKFPTTTTPASVVTARERPYPFYNSDKSSTGKSYNVPLMHDQFMNSRPLEKMPTVDEWNKFLNYEKRKQVVQKNRFDFTAPVPSPVASYGPSAGGQKTGFDFGAIAKPQGHGMQENPWKKIIKFLTAFIPIGLLISALTPTVITVQNVNGTQSRSRAVESSSFHNNKLVSSLNYFNSVGCEDRILCELVLSASTTQNAEHHVENLLNTFTQEGKAVEKAEEMRRILDAVQKQDCRSIICKNMKEKT